VIVGSYEVRLRISPNAGGRRDNDFTVRTTRGGRPVAAAVSLRFTMPAMAMPSLGLGLRERSVGTAVGTGQTLTMPGRWVIRIAVRPRGQASFAVVLEDVVRL
jgi:hypothetical protein